MITLKLTKQAETHDNCKFIVLTNKTGNKIGSIFVDGGFIPAGYFELRPEDLRQILTIQKNFWLFWNNI